MKGHFPVGHGCEFRNEITDPGTPENFRCVQTHGSVENHAEWHGRRQRATAVTDGYAGLGLQKPSFESDVGMERQGSRQRNAMYLATSNALPPPNPIVPGR